MFSFSSVSLAVWLILVLHGACRAESHGREYYNKVPNQRITKFGCIFENENYYVPTDSVFNPVYGEELKPMDFANVAEFSNMLKKIDTEYSKLLENLVSTNIPEFYDFYDTYKVLKQQKNSTTDFYRNYVPKTFPRHASVSAAIEILDRLMELYPNMSESFHLVTSSLSDKEKLLQELDMMETCLWPAKCFLWETPERKTFKIGEFCSSSKQEPPKYLFTHDHVAGLLRIRIGGKRLGYVLMDPGYSLNKPIVIMEDGQAPQRALGHNYHSISAMEEMDFCLPRRDYILADTYALERAMTVKVRHQNPEYLLYYIDKPYCSFLTTTIKKNIITQPLRAISRYGFTGFPIASITFDVTQVHPTFNVALRLAKSDAVEGTIQFGNRYKLKEKMKSFYNQVIDKINYDNLENILDKAEDIANDKDFLMYLKKVAKGL